MCGEYWITADIGEVDLVHPSIFKKLLSIDIAFDCL